MQQALLCLTLLGSVIAFAFATWRYLDTRRRELHQRRFEQFHRVFVWVAGVNDNGQKFVDTSQALAVYELAEFPEYRHMTLPILDHYLKLTDGESDDSLFRRSLLATKRRLEQAG